MSDAIPHRVWAEQAERRDGWFGYYSTAKGVRCVTSRLMQRVKVMFPTELAAIKAASDAQCRELDAEEAPRSIAAKIFVPSSKGKNKVMRQVQ